MTTRCDLSATINYSNSLIHIFLLSNSPNDVASLQKNRGDKSHCVIVALAKQCHQDIAGPTSIAYVWEYNTVSENSRFCVADFSTLSDEKRSRSKIFLLFNMDKRTLRFENLKGLHVRKFLGSRKLNSEMNMLQGLAGPKLTKFLNFFSRLKQ